ncbi:T7SS effector LXG polymorphic toxin [Enterococcus sp. AZ177]|uniref:T7SS effector LXG polymorphic toxin n=1 Tax=unclassified Enterococcus TaxID=2608891 RepID=UPI003D2FF488
MGFYVDTAEMKKAVEEYQKLSKTAQSQLNTAKNAMNGIINSNALSGKVGQAISADINNNQNAVIVGLKSSYLAVEMELRQAYQDFKGTTGETSDSAVLSEEVLTKAKSDIDKMKQTYQEQVKSFQSVYSSISDLISLSASKSDFNQVADATKKYADEIIQKVNQFDSKQGNSANEDMIQSLSTQIKAAQKVGGLGYTDPRFLAFANSTALADNVQAFQKNVTEADEKQRKTKEKDLNSMTPSEMIAKYGVDDPDVKKRINDINNGISYTAFNKSVENLGYGQAIGDGVLQGLKMTGKNMRVDALQMGSRSISPNELSRIGKRARALESAGDDLINTSNAVSGSKIWKGLGIVGTVAGAAFDYNDQMTQHNDQARAIKNTIAHSVIGSGGAAVGGQIGAWLGTAIPIPVVGTVIGAVVGAGIGVAVSGIYDWIESGEAKKSFDKKSKEVSERFNDVKENASKWFSNVGKSLGGAFN